MIDQTSLLVDELYSCELETNVTPEEVYTHQWFAIEPSKETISENRTPYVIYKGMMWVGVKKGKTQNE